jgi:hypothetical protein
MTEYETEIHGLEWKALLSEYESIIMAYAAGESPGLNCERVRLVRREVGRRLAAMIKQ